MCQSKIDFVLNYVDRQQKLEAYEKTAATISIQIEKIFVHVMRKVTLDM